MSKALFDKVAFICSRQTTLQYSTSFSIGIRCFDKSLREPIYSIYGFVRFADEIVDTFHDYNKAELLQRFKEDTLRAVHDRISLNPILNAFQQTVHRYNIEPELYLQFLKSMEMDLTKTSFSDEEVKEYILGSAEVVGLMSLRVFCDGNDELYQQLKPSAMSLGSAFQKINFLRDINADYSMLGRNYFPGVDLSQFNDRAKQTIEENIQEEFHAGFRGIRQLPRSSRLGVYVAYLYYYTLFKKIKTTPVHEVMRNRIRVKNRTKLSILAYSFFKHQLNLI